MLSAMSELEKVQHLLEDAKRAADAGDLAAADALLQDTARIQEAELGPLHPELANTVNNLAIVAEMSGRIDDAEVYYRRAVAITSASLPPDDPIVASSRKTLEDFCRERGVPFDAPPTPPSIQQTEHPSGVVAGDQAIGEARTPAPVQVAEPHVPAQTSAPASGPPSVAGSIDSTDREPASAPRRSIAFAAIGLVVLAAAALFLTRAWSPRESPAAGKTVEPAVPQAEPAPAPPAVAAPTPIKQPKPPAGASRSEQSRVAATPPSPGRSSGGMTLVTSQLCRTFSFGQNWRCDAADQTVAPGPLVLYTRVKSPRDAIVIHRWYIGDTLRKSARLPILANTTEGYRTYSRQTVNSGEHWRVEVRDTAGDLLYEQRVSVR